MKKHLILLFMAPLAAIAGVIEQGAGGTLKIGDRGALGLAHYAGSNWTSLTRHPASWQNGEWKLRGESTPVTCKVNTEKLGAEHFRLSWSLAAKQPVRADTLAIQLELPIEAADAFSVLPGRSVRVDGKTAVFPKEQVANGVFFRQENASTVQIPLREGMLVLTMQSKADVRLLDFRVWNSAVYAVRFSVPLDRPGAFKQMRFSLDVRLQPWRIEPLEIGSGTERDDARLPRGFAEAPDSLKIAPFRFNVNRNCIAVGREFPARAVVPLRGETLRRLYLVHALAWPPEIGTEAGKIVCRFTDGTAREIPVIAGRDVDNHYNGSALPNNFVIFSAPREAGWQDRLGMSAFELPDKPLKAIEFLSSGNGGGRWMILAAAASPDEIPVARNENETAKENADWRRFAFSPEVEQGSALDFSFLADAPAGKHGRVVADGEIFRFENTGKPIRFFGTNLGYTANFMSHDEAEKLAERFARIGYNSLRIHLFDRDLMAGDSIDPAQLDRLDYLVHAMKKQGIYITIDLFSGRPYRDGTFVTDRDYKLGVIIDPGLRDHLKAFSRALLDHRNPYTGFRWADDPALALLNIVNENTILHQIKFVSEPVKKRFARHFAEWKTQRPNGAERDFLQERYREFFLDMKAFLRELGVRAPLTDQNYIASPNIADGRAEYDFVDLHLYGDHQTFLGKNWQLPGRIINRSQLAKQLSSPLQIAPARLFGKPFTVTEFDICYPNEFRAEGALLFGAFAAQQNWSALYRFDYAGHQRELFGAPRLVFFETVHDPMRLLGERLGLAAFLRGDVSPAPERFEIALAPEKLKNYQETYPQELQQLALYGQIGTVLAAENAFPATPPSPPGGELTVNYEEQTFHMVTPRSEAAILPAGKSVSGKHLSVRSVEGFSVLGAVALGGGTLTEADRLLLLHLTDNKQEGLEYQSSEHGLTIYKQGTGGLLGRRGVAEVALELADRDWKLYALDCSGGRVAEVPFRRESGKLCFTADTFRLPQTVVFAYELCTLIK